MQDISQPFSHPDRTLQQNDLLAGFVRFPHGLRHFLNAPVEFRRGLSFDKKVGASVAVAGKLARTEFLQVQVMMTLCELGKTFGSKEQFLRRQRNSSR